MSFEERYEEQLSLTVPISEETVLLSATTMKVELVFFEWNIANSSAPPGRDVLSGRPYCTMQFALETRGFGKVILSPNAPLPSRTGMHFGHFHTKLLARSNTESLAPRRHDVEPRLQGSRFHIYCKRAYNGILVSEIRRSVVVVWRTLHTCSHIHPVCYHRPQCAQQMAIRERLALLRLHHHHSLSRSSYSSGGSHHPASPYSVFPMTRCRCPYCP